MGILSRLTNKRTYKKAYGRNKPWTRFNRIGYISNSSTGFTSNSFLKSINKKKKSKLIISGKKSYINKMYKHLRKEHPSTKKRMIKK